MDHINHRQRRRWFLLIGGAPFSFLIHRGILLLLVTVLTLDLPPLRFSFCMQFVSFSPHCLSNCAREGLQAFRLKRTPFASLSNMTKSSIPSFVLLAPCTPCFPPSFFAGGRSTYFYISFLLYFLTSSSPILSLVAIPISPRPFTFYVSICFFRTFY